MNTIQKQRMLWIGGLILVGLYYCGPSILHTGRQNANRNAAPHPAPSKTAKDASPLPAPTDSSPIVSGDLLGIWQGIGPLPGHDVCNLRLELRRKTDDPAHVAGFPVLVCMPLMPGFVRRGAGAENFVPPQPSPISAVLTGTAQNGGIQFSVDKVIGTAANGCALTALTVTPFGTDQIAAQWQEGTCQGGQILLRKTGK